MKKNKGFTLVEVIISLAILGIICVSFLGAISSHFTYMTSTKRITQNAFKAQEMMENEIDQSKGRITDGSASLEKMNIFTSDLGGIEVRYEDLKISHNKKDYYTLVSDVKPDPLEIISLESIGIKLMQGGTQVQDDYYGYAKNQFSLVGNFNNKTLYKWDHLLNQVEWYVTTKKFNMPYPRNQSADLNDEGFYYYPLFPRDYEIYSNETIYKFGASQSSFPYIEDMAGRHIIYTVTPAAKSGKLGERKVSKPLFISGLPVTNNLLTHLDASYIDVLSGSTEAQKVGEDYLLNRWYDISSIMGTSTPGESGGSTGTNRPIVSRTPVDVEFLGEKFIGQYIAFEPGRYVQINNQASSGQEVVIYTVVRNRSSDVSKYLVNGANELTVEGVTEENAANWNIISSKVTLDGLDLKIGDSSSDIGEIIIYSGNIGQEDNLRVLDYLSSKYFSNNIVLN